MLAAFTFDNQLNSVDKQVVMTGKNRSIYFKLLSKGANSMNGNSGFFAEDELRRDTVSPDAKRRRENRAKVRSIRKKERDKLKQKMVTRKGLLFPETKSAYEWKKLDRKRFARTKTKLKPKYTASDPPGIDAEDDLEQNESQTKKRPKRKDNH